MKNIILEDALKYATKGWAVLPLNGKIPVTSNGLDDASCDPSVISGWFKNRPKLNVGLRTGICFDVLDFDFVPPSDFYNYETPMTKTGKGIHILVQPTGSGNRAGILFDENGKVDIRGRRGYIVAPPSVHPDSKERYAWIKSMDTPIMRASGTLAELIAPPPKKERTSLPYSGGKIYKVDSLAKYYLQNATEGTRNNLLNWCAWRLGEDYVVGLISTEELEEATACLLDAALAAGLPESESDKTIRSGIRGGSNSS